MTWKAPAPVFKAKQLVTPTTHLATIVAIVDLGRHEYVYMGEKKSAQKVLFTWELSDQFYTPGDEPSSYDGLPLVLTQEHNFTMGMNANLKVNLVDKIEGRTLDKDEASEYDIGSLLGKQAQLIVSNPKSKTTGMPYSKIEGISPLRPTDKLPPTHAKPYIYRRSQHDEATYSLIPKWIKEKVEGYVAEDKPSNSSLASKL